MRFAASELGPRCILPLAVKLHRLPIFHHFLAQTGTENRPRASTQLSTPAIGPWLDKTGPVEAVSAREPSAVVRVRALAGNLAAETGAA